MLSDIIRMLHRSMGYEQAWVNHPHPSVAKDYLDSKACIDLPAFIKAVSRVAKYDFETALWFATGGSKLVFFMVPKEPDASERPPVVARVCRPDFAFGHSGQRDWQEMCNTVSCEFAVTRFLGEKHPGIPVPAVKGYSVEREKGVPPFIVEEWVDAEPASLRNLNLEELQSFGQCLRDITSEWNQINFEGIGALHPCGTTHEIKSWGSEMQMFMPPFIASASPSVQAWYYSLIDVQIEPLRSPNRSIHQAKVPTFTTNQTSFALRCYENLQRWSTTSERFQRFCSTRLALIHTDLQASNILVSRDGDGHMKISAVIDWELAFVGPSYLFRARHRPNVIQQFTQAWARLSSEPVPLIFVIDDGSKLEDMWPVHRLATSGLQDFPAFFNDIWQHCQDVKGMGIFRLDDGAESAAA